MFSRLVNEINKGKLDKKLKNHCNNYISSIYQNGEYIIRSNDCSETINLESINQYYSGYMEYEASRNEELFPEKALAKNILNILLLLNYLSLGIKSKFPDYIFDFYIAHSEDGVNFRFHKSRSSEESWLNEDIDKYQEGVIHINL